MVYIRRNCGKVSPFTQVVLVTRKWNKLQIELLQLSIDQSATENFLYIATPEENYRSRRALLLEIPSGVLRRLDHHKYYLRAAGCTCRCDV